MPEGEGWATKVTGESSTALEMTVYSPSRYQLAHLLEHGFEMFSIYEILELWGSNLFTDVSAKKNGAAPNGN